jgi:hypothetical protein
MKRVLLTAIAAAILPLVALAQVRPDFSGNWTRDEARSDPALGPGRGGGGGHTIKQTATEIVITIAGRGGPETSIYKLDGSESLNQSQSPAGPLTVKGRATWEGASLVIETTREIQGMTITTREVRTLDASGKEMTIEATTRAPQGDIKRKIVFTKS